MAMLLRNSVQIKDRRDPDQGNPLDAVNSQGYQVVGAMTHQLGDLEDICDFNSQEDVMRAKLGNILREQEKVLSRMGKASHEALDLNRRAQATLSLVDILDAAQGLDTKQPLKRARVRNREAHAAGREIIRLTEPAAQPSRREPDAIVA